MYQYIIQKQTDTGENQLIGIKNGFFWKNSTDGEWGKCKDRGCNKGPTFFLKNL